MRAVWRIPSRRLFRAFTPPRAGALILSFRSLHGHAGGTVVENLRLLLWSKKPLPCLGHASGPACEQVTRDWMPRSPARDFDSGVCARIDLLPNRVVSAAACSLASMRASHFPSPALSRNGARPGARAARREVNAPPPCFFHLTGRERARGPRMALQRAVIQGHFRLASTTASRRHASRHGRRTQWNTQRLSSSGA